MKRRFRLIMMPKRLPQGAWRDTREAAQEDAIKLGLAERDEHDPKRLWWHPLAEIEEEQLA